MIISNISNSVLCIQTNQINIDTLSLESYSNELVVHFINIGQGDSILLQSPDNTFVLIDTGSRTYSNYLINYLNNLNVEVLEAFIATHPHEDHIGGAQELFETFDIKSVYHPGYDYSSATYSRFIDAAENEDCSIFTDDELDPGDYIQISSTYSCQILSINKFASNTNDASIVLRVDYQLISFLFTGDINGDKGDFVEKQITDLFNVNIDILKVSHHGSRHASTDSFLNEATPEISIISCGEDNSYGHPHSETLYRLSKQNSEIFRTDSNGNIKVITDGNKYHINYETPENPPNPPVISGQNNGMSGITYTYSAKSNDPNDDLVYYQWNWGDGNITDWLGPHESNKEVYRSYRWLENGAYTISVRTKDINNQVSNWNHYNVVMPKKIIKNEHILLKILYSLFNLKNHIIKY